MAESIMTFALGFLLAALIALSSAVPFWRRAVQITKKRLLAVTPQSSVDIDADRDHLRADFALSTRKLERSIGSLQNKTHNQVLQIAQRAKDIRELNEKISQKSKITKEQGIEIEQLKKSLNQVEADRADRVADITDLKEKAAELETLVARQAGIVKDAKEHVETSNKEIAKLNKTVVQTTTALEKSRAEVAVRDEKLSTALRIAAERKESAGELAKELLLVRKALVAMESQKDGLAEKFSRQSSESTLRISALTAAGAKVERELMQARGEIAKLTEQVQNVTEQRDALSKNTHKEAAMLREQLADLTSKVDRTTSEIEKVGSDAGLTPSPLVAALANSESTPAKPTAAVAKPTTAPAKKKDLATSLAERIRSLQEHQNQRA